MTKQKLIQPNRDFFNDSNKLIEIVLWWFRKLSLDQWKWKFKNSFIRIQKKLWNDDPEWCWFFSWESNCMLNEATVSEREK